MDATKVRMKMRRRRLAWLLRVAATVGVCGFLVVKAPWEDMLRATHGLAWFPLVLAALVLPCYKLLRGVRWWLLLRRPGQRGRLVPMLRVSWLGDLYGSFLPSTVGGDAYRLIAVRGKVRLSVSAASLMADRLIGFLAVVLGFLLGFVATNTYQGKVAVGSIAQVAVAAIIVLALTLFVSSWPARVAESLACCVKGKRWHRGFGLLSDSVSTMGEYRRDPATVAGTVALSILVALCPVASTWLILEALGARVPVTDLFVPVFGSLLVATLPIFIGGLGGREAAFVGLLSLSGVSVDIAGVAALIKLVLGRFLMIVGGAICLVSEAHRGGKKWPSRQGSPVARRAGGD